MCRGERHALAGFVTRRSISFLFLLSFFSLSSLFSLFIFLALLFLSYLSLFTTRCALSLRASRRARDSIYLSSHSALALRYRVAYFRRHSFSFSFAASLSCRLSGRVSHLNDSSCRRTAATSPVVARHHLWSRGLSDHFRLGQGDWAGRRPSHAVSGSELPWRRLSAMAIDAKLSFWGCVSTSVPRSVISFYLSLRARAAFITHPLALAELSSHLTYSSISSLSPSVHRGTGPSRP